MTITVQISDFRNNMSNYIDQMIDQQSVIDIKRGNTVIAKMVPKIKTKKKKQVNMAENVLRDLENVRKKIRLKTKSKTTENLSNEIDRMVYGIDRNGRKLSSR